MRVLITGSSGTIGTALRKRLAERGDGIVRLVRRKPQAEDERQWQPGEGTIDAGALDGVDAVVNLAGYPIAAKRWTDEVKRKIRDSRVKSTQLLVDAVLKSSRRPQVFVSGSATGYYGDRGAERLTEEAAAGEGFLADVAQEWEQASRPISQAGIRRPVPRTGVVLATQDGALAKMLPIFKVGLGGKLGDGRQSMSWIGLTDMVETLLFALDEPDLDGPFNATAPEPVTNAEFTEVLADVLGRPSFVTAPAFAVRLGLGEMADALLLASTRAVPQKLLAAGFAFRFPDLRAALRHELGME